MTTSIGMLRLPLLSLTNAKWALVQFFINLKYNDVILSLPSLPPTVLVWCPGIAGKA